MKREVSFEVIVSVECPDELWDDLITVAAEPKSERNYYGFDSEDAVVNHLAWNRIKNGQYDANRLDGWADLDENVLTMDIEDIWPIG